MSEPERLVQAEWLRDRLPDERLRVLDATVFLTFDEQGAHVESGRAAYEEAHVPTAAFADLVGALSDPDGEAPFAAAPSDRFAEAVGALGVSNDTPVVVYDQVNGIWATRLWWQFRLEGYDDVRVLDGGLDAWRAAGYETATGVESYPPAAFTARRRPELLRSTADVEAALGRSDVVLVNALETESFAEGHIPGSVNVPFVDLVDERGRLRPAEELRARFAAAGVLDPARQPVTYCGGGIAATAAAFALAAVGRDDVAVYDGSMNAWTADPSRPLE